MKHLEDTPWWICDEGDFNFCAYVDTDSNYFNAEPLLKHLYPDFEDKTDQEKDDLLEKVALKYQDIITEYYDTLAREAFNVPTHRLEMKTEAVIRTAYFRATRRYAQWITKKEGRAVEELDIKGLEFKKANFPKYFGKFYQEILELIIKGTPQSIVDKKIHEFRQEATSSDVDFTLIGNPTSVKTLNEYVASHPKPGKILSEIKPGAGASVKASIKHNDLLRFWQLDSKHSQIVQGDKVKWVYLKNNPYNIEAIAFLEFDLSDKIKDFINEYIDRGKSFETILQNKLQGFYDDLEWSLPPANPLIHKFFTFS
jgi:DNA polymerase elongation subunit (family B)